MQRNFRANAKPPDPKEDLLLYKKLREMISYGNGVLNNGQFPRKYRIGNTIGAQIEKSMFEAMRLIKFANIYLNELDQFIKHELHLHYVVRYMDDIIILHDDYRELVQFKEKIEAFLENVLRLNLNDKTTINPTTHNIEFVGFIINKNEIKLRKDTVQRMRVRIKYVMKAYAAGEMTFKEVNATMQSYFGLISHCTNKGLREKIIRDFVLYCTDKSRERALQEI